MKSFAIPIFSLVPMAATAIVLFGVLASPSHALTLREFMTTGVPAMSGSFVRTYPFTASVTGAIDYFASRLDFPPPYSITSFVATLFTTSSPVSDTDGVPVDVLMPNSFFLGSLAPGDQLRVNGLASGMASADSYRRALRATPPPAPTPDPEVWAMMLVGVGLIAMRLRRKSRLDSARRFA